MHLFGAFFIWITSPYHSIFLDNLSFFSYLKFMKRNKIIPIIVATLNFCLCLSLLIFLTPNNVPLISGIKDEILVIGSKWWLLSGIILPLIFLVFTLTLKGKFQKLIFSELIIFVSYNNMLGYAYFCNESSFICGELSQIPISLSLFLPIALAVFVYGSIIKHIDYKNKFGIYSKLTTTTEFIWKQSHITASYHYMLSGLILLIISIIFVFVHYPLIELALFVVFLTIPRIVVEVGAKKMSAKYADIKKKYDHAQSQKNKA